MRVLIRVLLGLVLIVVVGFILLGYRPSWSSDVSDRPSSAPVGTSGGININMEKARERAATVGEKAANAAETVRETIGETGLTAKIKAKMALDDSVKALAIDVTTVGSTVTLSGRVRSLAERTRAVALARETDGVTRVVDNLQIKN